MDEAAEHAVDRRRSEIWESLRLLAAVILLFGFVVGTAVVYLVPPVRTGPVVDVGMSLGRGFGFAGVSACLGWFIMLRAAWRCFTRGEPFEMPEGVFPLRGRWLRTVAFAVPVLGPPACFYNALLWFPLWLLLLSPCAIVERIVRGREQGRREGAPGGRARLPE